MLTTAAQIVVRIRAERELSMSALGVLAGVPTSTISRIESGRIEPTLGMIRRIALGAGFHLQVQYYDVVEDRSDDDMVQVAAGDLSNEGEAEDEARC